jgi:hypothetical protein
VLVGAIDDGKEWRCADISSDAPTKKGSFAITRGGWRKEWDGGYPVKSTGILQTITSEERRQLDHESPPSLIVEIVAAWAYPSAISVPR